MSSSKSKENKIDLSIVIPVYNEKQSIDSLYKDLESVLPELGKSYEVILIDDGSMDGTYDELLKAHQKNKAYKIIKFRKNFGQTAAMKAGFDYSKGEVVITLDADLQNDPADIPEMLDKLNDGYDIVSGWRKHRKDNTLIRNFPSAVANRIISTLTGVYLHDYGCTLKAYRKEVIKNLELYGEMHRYIPALASWMGVKIAEIPVRHHSRKFGKAKYGISKTIRVILDIMVVKFYSQKPIQVFGLIGLIAGAIGFIVTAYLTIMRIFFNQGLASRPLFTLSIFMILIGIQLITMGLLAELIMRTYHESQNKSIYVVKEIIE